MYINVYTVCTYPVPWARNSHRKPLPEQRFPFFFVPQENSSRTIGKVIMLRIKYSRKKVFDTEELESKNLRMHSTNIS